MYQDEKITKCQRVWAEIDLDTIESNIRNMKNNIAPDTKMIAVIKADGYGHGSLPIAKDIEQVDYLFGFATATFEEAMELRIGGIRKPILILGYTFPYCYEDLISEEIRPTVFRKDSVEELSRQAVKIGKSVKVHVAVDTGMSRIGVKPDDEGLSFVKDIMKLPGIEIEGIFTHFAKADMTSLDSANIQLEKFTSFIGRIEKELGLIIPIKHCSNSAGIIRMPEANLDVVRAGITLYGLWPSNEVEKDIVDLHPALSLKSHIVMVKELQEGAQIGYGGTFTVTRPTRVATIPVGYADGYPRQLSGKGSVLINRQQAKILGRICMDQMMVDVTDIDAREGDEVTLIGREGDLELTAEALGDLSGRFNYELVCDINKRVPRIYLKRGMTIGDGAYGMTIGDGAYGTKKAL